MSEETSENSNVGLVGLGAMGRGMAGSLRRAGHHVHVYDVRAEADAKEQLKASYLRFIDEKEPALKNQAGVDLIRSIFGTDAIAEDSVR